MRAHTLALALLLVGCPAPEPTSEQPAVDEPSEAAQPLEVVATSFPADYLVQRIGGDAVVVDNILPAGEDAPFWSPPIEAIGRAQAAPLIVSNGASYEKWMSTTTLPEDIVVDSTVGIDLISIPGVTHSHGKAGKHSHAGTDPHTFGAPPLYLAQAQNVHDALVKAAPVHAPTFGANLDTLKSQLTALDEAYAAALQPAAGRVIGANHPAWNYLARQYGLDILSLYVDPSDPPTDKAVAKVKEWAAGVEEPVMLWEAQPTDEVVAALPEGIRHVVVDPLEQPGQGGTYDYVAQANANVTVFLEAFPPAAAPVEGAEPPDAGQ